MGKHVGVFSFPHHLSPPLLDAFVTVPGLQLLGLQTGMIPKQETVTMFLTIFIRSPKDLMGPEVHSSHLAKLGLRVKADVFLVVSITPQWCPCVNGNELVVVMGEGRGTLVELALFPII